MENSKKTLVNRLVRKSKYSQPLLDDDLIELEDGGDEMIAQNLEMYTFHKLNGLEKKGEYAMALDFLLTMLRKFPDGVNTRILLDEFIRRLNDILIKSMTDNVEVYGCLKLYEQLTDLGHTNTDLTWIAIEKYGMLGMTEKELKLKNAFLFVNPNYIRG